eukprot:5886317-Amphidinium_carterae.1
MFDGFQVWHLLSTAIEGMFANMATVQNRCECTTAGQALDHPRHPLLSDSTASLHTVTISQMHFARAVN